VCGRSRNMRVQQIYSITSSARASSDGGTSMPSALAVIRLKAASSGTGSPRYLIRKCSMGTTPLQPESLPSKTSTSRIANPTELPGL
jgi:hypothetical protein